MDWPSEATKFSDLQVRQLETETNPRVEEVLRAINSHKLKHALGGWIILDLGVTQRRDAYVWGMPPNAENIEELIKHYPTAEDFRDGIFELAYNYGSHMGTGIPVMLTARHQLEELGKIIYPDEWQSQVNTPRRQRRQRAYPVSKSYLSKGMIAGKVPDGFVDAGRGSSLSKVGEVEVDPDTEGREILVVDRVEDVGLNRILEQAQEIVAKIPDQMEATFAIAHLIFQMLRGDEKPDIITKKHKQLSGKQVFIGDFDTSTGFSGVCRHFALLFHTVMTDMGFETRLRRGFYERDGVSGSHAWCEMRLLGKPHVVDLATEANLFRGTYREFQRWGGLPSPNIDRSSRSDVDKRQYYNADNQWIYSTR